VAEISTGKDHPYFEVELANNVKYRRFEDTVGDEELVWHRDKNDRRITVIEGKDWKLQFDNELPEELVNGQSYFIQAEEYHRLIKGQGQLIIEVTEEI
jgi:hypothetical protein